MGKFTISESEKQHIKRLYGINEVVYNILNEQDSDISENTKIKIFQAMNNFWNDGKTLIYVDGIVGDQTKNAIKLQLTNNNLNFDKAGLSTQYQTILNGIITKHLSNLKNTSNVHSIRMLQSILNLSGESIDIDGIIGPITKKAIKNKLGDEDITKVGDEKLKELINKVIEKVKTDDLTFKVDGGETSNTENVTTTTTTSNQTGTESNASQLDPDKLRKEALNEFKNGLFNIYKTGGGYTYKKGTFKIDEDGTVSFYDVYNTLMGSAKYSKQDEVFTERAKKFGFNQSGCWTVRRIRESDGYSYALAGLYLFKCQSGDIYGYNQSMEDMKSKSYVYYNSKNPVTL